MCSYQHTGFVLIETSAGPVVLKEHRGTEFFGGSFNCIETWRQELLLIIYIKVAARANHLKTSTANKMLHQHSFFSYIRSWISVPEQTLSSGFCPPDSLIYSAPFLSLLEQMLNVDVLLWVYSNKNMPTLLLSEHLRFPEDTVNSFFLCILFLRSFCSGLFFGDNCGLLFFGESVVAVPSAESKQIPIPQVYRDCTLKNNWVKIERQVGFLHWTPFGGLLSWMAAESWE